MWDAARRRLLWVDILAGTVLEGVAGREPDRGHRAAGLRRHGRRGHGRRRRHAARGRRRRGSSSSAPTGTRIDGPRVVPAGERRRLNDGKTDPAGRFLVGTMPLDGRVGARGARAARGRRPPDADRRRPDALQRAGLVGRRPDHVQRRHRCGARSSPATYDPDDRSGGGAPGAPAARRRRPGRHRARRRGAPLGGRPRGRAGAAVRSGRRSGRPPRRAGPAHHQRRLRRRRPAHAGRSRPRTGSCAEEERRAHPESGRLFTTRVDVPGAARGPVVGRRPPSR